MDKEFCRKILNQIIEIENIIPSEIEPNLSSFISKYGEMEYRYWRKSNVGHRIIDYLHALKLRKALKSSTPTDKTYVRTVKIGRFNIYDELILKIQKNPSYSLKKAFKIKDARPWAYINFSDSRRAIDDNSDAPIKTIKIDGITIYYKIENYYI